MTVTGKRTSGFDEAKNPGDFFWSNPIKILRFICPCGCGSVGGVNVSGEPSREPIWEWNGNLDKPTMRPSIRFLSGCQWHGYLTDGIFTSC